MTQKEVVYEIIGFFMVPGECEENEEHHFGEILNFQLVSKLEDERIYELNNILKRLEFLKQQMITFAKPSFYHIAKIDRFNKFCKENTVHSDVRDKHTLKISKLSDLICSDKGELIVERIKVQYRNIKGKRLKLLLLALQNLQLLPPERITSKFHQLCKIEFDWEIGSRTMLNDYPYNPITDSSEFNQMKKYIENIIK